MNTCTLEHGQGIIVCLVIEELLQQDFGIACLAWG